MAAILCALEPACIHETMCSRALCRDDYCDTFCAVQCIKRFIMHSKKTAFIVEHDFIMAAYLADRVILYEGKPSEEVCSCAPPTLGVLVSLKSVPYQGPA